MLTMPITENDLKCEVQDFLAMAFELKTNFKSRVFFEKDGTLYAAIADNDKEWRMPLVIAQSFPLAWKCARYAMDTAMRMLQLVLAQPWRCLTYRWLDDSGSGSLPRDDEVSRIQQIIGELLAGLQEITAKPDFYDEFSYPGQEVLVC